MSHDATNWAIKQRGLKPQVKLLLWHLADRHNPDQGCFPKQDTLAEDCEISRASVNRYLDELEVAGLIRREPSRDPATNRQLPTRYRLACEPDFNEAQDVGVRVSDCDTESRVSNPADSVSQSCETLTSNRTSKIPLTPEQAQRSAPQDVVQDRFVHATLEEDLYRECCRLKHNRNPAVTDRNGGWRFPVVIIETAQASLAAKGVR